MNSSDAFIKAVIWLQTAAGLGSGTLNRILTLSRSAVERIPSDPAGSYAVVKSAAGERTAQKVSAAPTDDDTYRRALNIIAVKDIKVVCRGDADYPDALEHIDNPPPVLYTIGDKSLMKSRCIAVVGSRSPTRQGEKAAHSFSEVLAKCSLTIVSGLARGIDAAAHRAALEAGGKTIAVLATGVDRVYPAENRALYEEVAAKGLLVSEYPPGTDAKAYRFPERNRIVSGISEAVLIPEAREKSGALITADCAIKQGKELFVVPSAVYSEHGRGSNRLLKELQGAMVLSPDDILESLGLYSAPAEAASVMELDVDEEKIMIRLGLGNAHFEELLALTGLKVSELNALLTGMEIKGLIYKAENNCYGVY